MALSWIIKKIKFIWFIHFCLALTLISFILNCSGTEETWPGQRSGSSCVWGSCRVPDSAEFGSFIMEAVSSTGKEMSIIL